MADKDPHTLATFAFAQLQRDPLFRQRFPKLRNVYVCVESDLMEDVRREAIEHFPDGGEIACYYPRHQRLMFVRHAGVGAFPSAGGDVLTANDRDGAITIGMIVDMLTKDPDWMDQLTEVSTHDVEKQPTFG